MGRTGKSDIKGNCAWTYFGGFSRLVMPLFLGTVVGIYYWGNKTKRISFAKVLLGKALHLTQRHRVMSCKVLHRGERNLLN